MHILLVEDSRSDALLLKDFLAEEKEAPEVHWVEDGREALAYVQQEGKYENAVRPDIILLDLAMPRLSGYETLQQLKRVAATSDIPVIILTTSYNPVDFKNCLGLGAQGFFSKPSNLQGYENLVQHLMGSEFPRVTQLARIAAGNIHQALKPELQDLADRQKVLRDFFSEKFPRNSNDCDSFKEFKRHAGRHWILRISDRK